MVVSFYGATLYPLADALYKGRKGANRRLLAEYKRLQIAPNISRLEFPLTLRAEHKSISHRILHCQCVFTGRKRSSHARTPYHACTGIEERRVIALSPGILRADSQVINEEVEPECGDSNLSHSSAWSEKCFLCC